MKDIIKFGRSMYDCKHHHCNLSFQNSHVEFSQKKGDEGAHALVKVAP